MQAQGWAPVMAPHQGWVGVYPGGPPPPYLAPHGHMGPPQTPFLQPYLQPPQPPRMHLEDALGAKGFRIQGSGVLDMWCTAVHTVSWTPPSHGPLFGVSQSAGRLCRCACVRM